MVITTLLNDLVGYYPLNGNGNDSMEIHNLTPRNGATYGEGVIKQGGSFVGGTSVMESSARVALGIANGFSVQAWVKTSSASYQVIVGRDWTLYPNNFSFMLQVEHIDGYVVVGRQTEAGAMVVTTSSVSVRDGNWHHVLYTWDTSAGSILYIDGVSRGTSASTAVNKDTVCSTAIGSWNESPFRSFTGSIDEVGIWKRALTTLEVSTLYNSGSAFPLGDYFKVSIEENDNQYPVFAYPS